VTGIPDDDRVLAFANLLIAAAKYYTVEVIEKIWQESSYPTPNMRGD